MSPGRSASIVIPVSNRLAYTRVCLAALAAATLDESEVIVVDNGSSDGTAMFLAEWSRAGESRRVVDMGANAGFARGCNAGAAAATYEVLVFLNNDTFVLPDWLPELLEPFGEADVMITGSRLLYPTGRVQHAGVAFDERGPHHVFAGLPGEHPAVLARREWQAVTGASMAVRADEFWRLGGFDETYLNSFEDVDLCLRVRAAGGRVVYVPTSIAYHFESVSEGRFGARDDENYRLFFERWHGRFTPDLRPALEAAAAVGWDMSDRVPPQAEALAALRATEQRVTGLEQRHREVEGRLGEAELLLSLRSVRAVLALRRLVARVLPGGIRDRRPAPGPDGAVDEATPAAP